MDWTFLSSGQPAATRHSSIRLYTFRELDALLRDAGLSAVDAYDQACGEPFVVGAGMRRVTVVARKG